jgi:hypothetical protein
VERVVSAKQRAANRANSLKSTGPKSEEGKFRAKLNSAKHGLSLPIDERVFADQIKRIVPLIRADCSTDTQAQELAKRIVDFERNEAFLQDFKEDELHDEIIAWGLDPRRLRLARLANSLRAKQPVSITFTLPQKDRPVTLKGKERTEELKFIEDFLKIQDRSMQGRVKRAKDAQLSALRYQKRAINQLVKCVRTVARGEEF